MVRKGHRERQDERRQRRVKIAMSVFIISIMVLSSLAFVLVFYAPQEGVPNTQFSIQDGQLYALIEGEQVPFFSYPDPSMFVPAGAISLLENADSVVVLFDPSDERNLPYVELIRWDISELLGKQSGGALLTASEQYPYPVSNCAQATAEQPFIMVINGTQSISLDGSCIVLEGQEQELLYLRDQLLYSYFGVQ